MPAATTVCFVAKGQVSCVGGNTSKQLGINNPPATSLSQVLPAGMTGALQVVTSADHTCALLTGGAAWCWGQNGSGQLGSSSGGLTEKPQAVSGSFPFKRLSAGGVPSGSSFTCGALPDHSIRC